MKSCWCTTLVAASFCLAISASASVTVQQLTEMAEAQRPEYRTLRDAIVAQGEAVLPELDRIYADQSLDWKPRFAAGVCIEHIRRADDLQAFLNHDWRNEPGFRDAGPFLATGYPRDCAPIIQKVEAEYGLWFYYMEVYAQKIFPEKDSKDYRLRGMGNMRVVLQACCQNEVHFFAAKMAEAMFIRYQNIRPLTEPAVLYLEDLAAYVADGTYPEGRALVLENIDKARPMNRTDFYEKVQRFGIQNVLDNRVTEEISPNVPVHDASSESSTLESSTLVPLENAPFEQEKMEMSP
jgi:hypothetical protein